MKGQVDPAPLAGPELRLHPNPESGYRCPACGRELVAVRAYVPGMRTLAELRCPGCERRYFGDLPAGHGLPFPTLLDVASGEAHHGGGMPIFAEHLANAYRERTSDRVELTIEQLRPLRAPILLNCLDWLYGHALLKLLNAQYHLDHHPDHDLVVLIPEFLRWMVPDGVAEIWTARVSLSGGWRWYDSLAEQVAERMKVAPEWWLSPAFPHPAPGTFELERFTRTAPFPLGEWGRPGAAPRVTYVWRGDREWMPTPPASRFPRIRNGIARRLRRLGAPPTARVTRFAERIREELGEVDFAVVGMDPTGAFPGWIEDLRESRPTAETERAWCARYARSHLVVGVHGSNMLLPSGHAGGVIEFVPDAPWDSRWGNVVQDLVVRGGDPRDVLFRYRFLPVGTTPADAARVAVSMIRDRPGNWALFDPANNDHAGVGDHYQALPELFRRPGA